jgi:predicted phosphodiesterase
MGLSVGAASTSGPQQRRSGTVMPGSADCGAMQLAILSDMHVPGQADALPDAFADRVAAADHVVHAGDFGSHEAIATVRDLAEDLTAVYGNADPVDAPLPAVDALDAGGVHLAVHHGEVNPVERAVYHAAEGLVKQRDDWLDAVADFARARAAADGADDATPVGVAGHSHEVEDEVHGGVLASAASGGSSRAERSDGVRVLNPGSATAAGPAEVATMMTATVEDGDLDVTVHEA